MTIKNLLDWIIRAHDQQADSGYNEITHQPSLCLKQALLKCQPTVKTHGYHADSGEIELAIAIAYTLNYSEISNMKYGCYQNTPLKIESYNSRRMNERMFPPPIRRSSRSSYMSPPPPPSNDYVAPPGPTSRPVDPPAPCPVSPVMVNHTAEEMYARLGELESQVSDAESELRRLTLESAEQDVG